MNWLNRIYSATLGRRRSLYNNLSEEIRQHLEEKTEMFQREGLSHEEAQLAARRAFGNSTLLEERSREIWQWPGLGNLLRDITFSARLLRKTPGFTLVAVLSLTLGIGANTAIFSLLNGLLLRPLNVPQADRLVVLHLNSSAVPSFCAPLIRALEPRREAFRNVFAFSVNSFQIREKDGIQNIPGTYVSGQYFTALQVPPQLGRVLTPADDSKDQSSAAYSAVLSDSFWHTHYNRAPNIIGQKLVISNVPFTIVGVMPKGFFGFDVTARPQLWIPLITEPRIDAPSDMLDAGYLMWWLRAGARLQPGVSLAQSNAWLHSATPSIVREVIPNPKWQIFGNSRDSLSVIADPGFAGFSYLRNVYRRPLLLVFAFCAGLLLIACVNIANLLLARAAVRHREIATRLAIGATRSRIIQQLLIDSLLLALLGAAAGLCLAPLASHALVAMLTHGQPLLYLNASIDWRVCFFVAVVAIASTLLVGLMPALQATAGDLNQHMKDGAHSTRGERRRLLPRFLLATEVALAMILVSAAGLLSASLYRLYHSGFGFDPHQVLLVSTDMSAQPEEGAPLLRLYSDIRDRFAALPGVRSAAYSSVTPLSGSEFMGSMHVPGGGDRTVYTNTVSSGYFGVLRIPLLAGRDFNPRDSSATESRILINQKAARMFFPNGEAVGKILDEPIGNGKSSSHRILGVVGDTKYSELREPSPPMIYHPAAATPEDKKPSYDFVLRVSGPIAPLPTALHRTLAQLAPDTPAPTFTTLDQQINDRIVIDRVMALLSAFFAISSLLVTAIGLYGVLAWSTARRTSEIGIRMALGAERAQVVALIFRENLWIALAGCAAGLAAAILASRALASFLYGTSPSDPWILSASLTLLCLVAAASSIIPALRAASIEPMQALRSE